MIYGFLTVVVAIAILAATDLNPLRKLRALRGKTAPEDGAAEDGADMDNVAADTQAEDTDPVMDAVERAVAPEDHGPEREAIAEAHEDEYDGDHFDFAPVAMADEAEDHAGDEDESIEIAEDEDESDAEDAFDIENLFDAVTLGARDDEGATADAEDRPASPVIDLFAGGTAVDSGAAPAVIEDYDAAEDQLVVVFDSALTPEPEITIAPVGDGDDVVVMLNGQPVMRVQDGAGLTPDDIELIETDLADAQPEPEAARIETATAA